MFKQNAINNAFNHIRYSTTHVQILGCKGSTSIQDIANARRFRLQNLWPWTKVRKRPDVHNVFTRRDGFHFDAIVLSSRM